MTTATQDTASRPSTAPSSASPAPSGADLVKSSQPSDDLLVNRARLIRHLMVARGAPLVMVVAPAGYGKTALLAQWSESDQRPFAWVALEQEHNTPLRLIRAVARAFHASGPLGAEVSAIDDVPDLDEALARLRELLETAASFVLVLDGAEVLQDPAALDVVATSIAHLGAGSQVALTSRIELGLPVGRLRAHRKLFELRASDLVMTHREAGWLAGLCGLELDSDGLDALVRCTEGWPAGLYLAIRTVREDPDPRTALAAFTGDDRAVADYLREELLSTLSSADLQFLYRSSVLDRLSGPLCDFVLDRQGSARLLRALSRMNLLLMPLDRTDHEYRYHRLLRQMLHSELRRCELEHERVLHERASAWYERQGDPERAIDHAISAGNAARAGRLLSTHAAKNVGYGSKSKMRAWLDRFDEEQISRSPTLALTAALSALVTGDRDLVERWIWAANRRLPLERPSERGSLEAAISVLHAAVGRQGIVEMADEVAEAYDSQAGASAWGALACVIQGVSRQLTGEDKSASMLLEEGSRRGAIAAPAIQVLALAQLALLEIDSGHWDAAELHAARAKGQVERTDLRDYATSALTYAVSAEVQAHIGRAETAQADGAEAGRLLASFTEFAPWYDAECAIVLARSRLRLSDVAGAQRLLAEAARHIRPIPEATVLHRWFDQCSIKANLSAKAHAKGAWCLTTAELRVLQFLPTHLSFPEIAERLDVSANTVKTHTRGVYRKLDAASRDEAVVRAREVGLLDPGANSSG